MEISESCIMYLEIEATENRLNIINNFLTVHEINTLYLVRKPHVTQNKYKRYSYLRCGSVLPELQGIKNIKELNIEYTWQ